MAARKGTRPPAAGRGRVKGARNKITADVKAMILGALTAKGGQAYLEQQADKNPVAFMSLLAKILPMQLTGGDGGPLVIQTMNFAEELAQHASEQRRRVRPIGKDSARRPMAASSEARPPNAGKGPPEGLAPTRSPARSKDMVLQALDEAAGGAAYLKR